MTPFEHEIIELHIALENWLGKAEGEGDSDALLARFRSAFLMIPPGGVHNVGLSLLKSGCKGTKNHEMLYIQNNYAL